MAKHKVTIQDVAHKAGTSPSTVSRVLNGSANVSPGLEQAVKQAVAELGYHPNLLARSLKTNTTLTVGLLINDLTNPFYSAIACSIEQQLSAYNYNLILCNISEDPDQELHYLQVLYRRHVDGIIFAPTGHNQDYIRELAEHIPLVQIDRQLSGVDLDTVIADNAGGAFRATKLLLDRGHRRIAVFGWNPGLTTTMLRLAGFERAMKKAQIEPDPELVMIKPDYQPNEFIDITRQLVSDGARPTAIFALNNKFGLAALTAIRELGLCLPDDLALVVFDDLDTFRLTTPAITAVTQPVTEIGQQSVALLMARLQPGDAQPVKTVTLPTQIIVRESV